ncbi:MULTISPECIES: hypothetical protein [Niastella]|uniref:Uncharacterized protein n=1 Tax=Niastella soli TaxID=2821487 RepID=A0ABS3YZ68_9BACT|nr:hypothetical protein [Niastella soli]MBO9203222.1 hypothetical protein [Niastella soli]
MEPLDFHTQAIEKLTRRYSNGIDNLITGNDVLHTHVFKEYIPDFSLPQYDIFLTGGDAPVLSCQLDNGNFFLMTTTQMFSIYSGVFARMNYKDYLWYSHKVFKANGPLFSEKNVKTRTWKYYSTDRKEFWYEIDSIQPADAADCCILYFARKAYNVPPPSLDDPVWGG